MRVVIVGGVAGGMSAATRLRRLRDDIDIEARSVAAAVSFRIGNVRDLRGRRCPPCPGDDGGQSCGRNVGPMDRPRLCGPNKDRGKREDRLQY